MKTPNHGNIIPLRDKIGYGTGNFSTGVAMQVIGAYLTFYSTAILGIPGSLVGTILSISILWDAVTDPLMGYYSDITRSKIFGRRHLYLIIGAIGIALTNYFIWHINADLSLGVKFLLIAILIIFFKTWMTVYVTPYTALGAEMSNDYNERTSIQAIKTIFFLLGLAFVSVAGMYFFFKPTPEFEAGQLNPQSYRNMGLISSIVVLVTAVLCFFITFKYIPILNKHQLNVQKGKKISALFSTFKSTVKNRIFRYVALCYMFNNIASALMSSIGLHVFTYTFSLDSQDIAMIIGAQFFVSIISQPVWSVISKRIDKKPAMILGLVFCLFGSIMFMFMVVFKEYFTGMPMYFIPYAAFAGFGTGALFTLPNSMVADTIDLDELENGRRSEGIYYGCLTLYYKTSQSITILIIGFMLDLIRFNADLPLQSNSTLISLGMILAIGSAISFVLSWVSIRKYPLTEKKVLEVQQQIMSRQPVIENAKVD